MRSRGSCGVGIVAVVVALVAVLVVLGGCHCHFLLVVPVESVPANADFFLPIVECNE